MMLITLHTTIQTHSSLKIIQIITITVQQGTLRQVNEIIIKFQIIVIVEATTIQRHPKARAVQSRRLIHRKNGNQVSLLFEQLFLYYKVRYDIITPIAASLSLTSHTSLFFPLLAFNDCWLLLYLSLLLFLFNFGDFIVSFVQQLKEQQGDLLKSEFLVTLWDFYRIFLIQFAGCKKIIIF